MDDKVKVAVDHIKAHVTYPATTEQVLEACSGWADVDPGLVEEGKTKLAAQAGKTWNSADELLAALGWSTADVGGAPTGGDATGGAPTGGTV